MVADFNQFVDLAKGMHQKDPTNIRCSTKMRGANDELVFKITDNVNVLKYKISNVSKFQ